MFKERDTTKWVIHHSPTLTIGLQALYERLSVSVGPTDSTPSVYDISWDYFHRPERSKSEWAEEVCKMLADGKAFSASGALEEWKRAT